MNQNKHAPRRRMTRREWRIRRCLRLARNWAVFLAACGAEGVTVLSNAAREPEIEDLQGFLNTCGAEITGAGTSTVVIRGGRPLHGGTYTILPDRIDSATKHCGTASAGGEVFLRDAREEHLSAVTAVLREAGCDVTGGSDGIVCRRTGRLTAPRPIRTAPYPGFPTDAQAILMAALLRCRGAAVFEENLFSSRYRHVDELARMGADIRVSGRTAVVLGVGRAIGEAMAIILVAGKVSNMPGLFTPVRILTTGIVSGMAYASVGSLYQQALYSIGLVLFLFIMLINVFLNVCVKNRKEG